MPEFFYALLFAHILADYLFQPDALIRWRERHFCGLLAHGSIVFLMTWLLSLPYAPGWWPYALFIAIAHTLIDAPRAHMGGNGPGPLAFGLFLLDQFVHVLIICLALAFSSYLPPARLTDFLAKLACKPKVLYPAIGYSLDTMPAWVFIRFLVRGLIPREELTFGNRYVLMLERILITTFVWLNQFWLIPLVVLPRLFFEGRHVWPLEEEENRASYLIELLSSVLIALLIGLALKG